jgi:hypothetical protein
MYEPKVSPIEGLEEDARFVELLDALGRSAHDSWAQRLIELGWRLADQRDDVAKGHPGLVPYESLPESERDMDRFIVRGVLGTLLALGYRILPPAVR